MRILITGGCGFIGSNLALHFRQVFPNAEIIAFDNLSRAGSSLNVPDLQRVGIQHIQGDIKNWDEFAELPKADLVIDAAAESSVLAGLSDGPGNLIQNNLRGSINVLRYVHRSRANLIFLSSSRVYSIKALHAIHLSENATRFNLASTQQQEGVTHQGISEQFSTDGSRSFYGACKLCTELLIQEYGKFYDLRYIINRSGVIAGPRQMGKVEQGVLMLWLSHHHWQRPLKYFGFGGKGKQVRDILHIDDFCRLVADQIIAFDRLSGQTYNVGGGRQSNTSLSELTALCQAETGKKTELSAAPHDRPADVPIYITDTRKIEQAAGWRPEKTVRDIIKDAYRWMVDNQEKLQPILAPE